MELVSEFENSPAVLENEFLFAKALRGDGGMTISGLPGEFILGFDILFLGHGGGGNSKGLASELGLGHSGGGGGGRGDATKVSA